MKEFFARLILNFIFILSIVIAWVCGIGIAISLLECAWDVMILCIILCPLGSATAITIGSTK
jgi:hypothetical protein